METIITSDERLEACFLRALQKFNSYQQPPKEEKLPINIGAPEAKQILAEIWGYPVSDSLFYKLSHRKELPSSGTVGNRLVFERDAVIEYAKSKVVKSLDIVSESVAKAARKKL